QAVDNENTGIDLISIFHKVALIPKVIIVASLIVSFRPDFFSDKCAFFNTVTAGDGSRQAARPIWIKWNAAITVIVIPAADGPDWDNGFQTFNTCCGNPIGNCAVIRFSNHAGFACRP